MSKKIFLSCPDHEKLKKNYFHQDYEPYVRNVGMANQETGILISDTSWCLYASMHLDGQFRTERINDTIDRVVLTGSIPAVSSDPFRQPAAPVEAPYAGPPTGAKLQQEVLDNAIDSVKKSFDNYDYCMEGGDAYTLIKGLIEHYRDIEFLDHEDLISLSKACLEATGY